MSGRAFLEALTAVVLAAVLLFVGSGLLALDGAGSAPAAFFDAGPRSAGTLVGIPFLVWAVAILLVAWLGRTRTRMTRLIAGIVITLAIGLLTLLFWVVVGGASGGFAALLVAIAIANVALFCVAALVGLAVTSLLLFRRRPAASGAVA